MFYLGIITWHFYPDISNLKKIAAPIRPEPNETLFEHFTLIFSQYIEIHNNYIESSFLLLQKALYT